MKRGENHHRSLWSQAPHGGIRTILVGLSLFALAACDPGIHVLNVQPVVTAIGPVSLDGDEVRMVFWAYDYEEDAVDAIVEIEVGGTRTPVVVTGGHGLNGLTTSREDSGQAHILNFKPPGSTSETMTVYITLLDDNDGRSETASLSFNPADGIAEPTPTQ